MGLLVYWLVYVPSVFVVVVGGNTAFARHDVKRLHQSIAACHCHCELVDGTWDVWMKPLLTANETMPHQSHFTGQSVICGTPSRLTEIREAIRAEHHLASLTPQVP